MKKSFIVFSLIILVSAAAFGAHRYKGDLNADGKVDLTDLGILARAINDGSGDSSFDLNTSGSLDDADLHTLASLIISETLIEDNSFNVGIGGWDDDDTDYGGTVGRSCAPRSRDTGLTNFYISNPCIEQPSGRHSAEFGILQSDECFYGILFGVRVPVELEFDPSEIVELSGDLIDGHALYGTPAVKEMNGEKVIRFIILSPELKPLKGAAGSLGRIYYDTYQASSQPAFSGCQALALGWDVAENVPEHYSEFIEWHADSNGITDMEDDGAGVSVNGGSIVISGLTGNTPVAIYDMQGRAVFVQPVTTESVSIEVPAGVYIVRIGDIAHKIAL